MKPLLLTLCSSGTKMSEIFKQDLRDDGVPENVIEALRVAMESITSGPAYAYAHAMERSFAEYGIEGVKYQVMYMLTNAGSWKGESARICKKILKKWSNH